ncbi:thiamine pyrophosphate-binding protein [Marivita sp.]|uniref:thiamine pyrophosphate-binding protein n=1 Tax=Marivita sp. TaxID=2003365 RepID=UPI003F6AD78B
MTRGADVVMQTLAAQGVKDIFALSGNQIMPLFDASLDAGIRLYHTRHEAAAVYMAEGYAQLSRGLGVALVTAGAGLGNAVGPLLTARASDTPVLLLSGDSPVARDGHGAFQEMDQVGLTQSLTKWSVRVSRADDLVEVITKAARVALEGRPGPVHVSLPADVLMAETVMSQAGPAQATDPTNVAGLRDWLDAAQRPIVVLGPALNATRQPDLATRLERSTGAPVVVMESPRGLKDPSLGALASVFADADRVLLLGKPLDFTLKFGAAASKAGWGVVNADRDEISRARGNCAERLTQSLMADPVDVARGLAAGGASDRDGTWCETVYAACAKRDDTFGQGVIHPNDISSAVQTALEDVAAPVLVCDGGEFGQWAQAGVTAPSRIINGVSGAIGGGLCYAMAARAANPNATVIAMMGDGTAGFHFAEFETAIRENLPFVAIIGNDLRWNAEHQIQVRDFGADRTHGCGLGEARYDQAVAALGGFGAYVTKVEDLTDTLRQAIASGKPACVNVMIDGQPAPVVA